MPGHRGIIVLLLTLTRLSFAQISPGELSAAHASLEGVDHCTQCHSIGKAIADDHCLSCHNEIAVRIAQKKGYHAAIGTKHCVDCHKEHHGRQFELVRFDKKAFNHSSVGYPLEGKHGKLTCEQCHIKEKIAAKDIQSLTEARKRTTMLGLSQECLSCHQDRHRGQLSAQCASCHTYDQWKPASRFTHARAKFPLTGKHGSVDCLRCHRNKLSDGTTVQYVNMEFGTCKSCHADPHSGKFQQPCAHCHTTDDFHLVKGMLFDHAATQFPLKGRHTAVKCGQCHSNNPKAKNASGEIGFHITRFKQCRDCHADAHAGQFDRRQDGGKCESCHVEDGFMIAAFSAADHAATKFPLNGSHRAVACAKCHEAGKVEAKSTRRFKWDMKIECTTCHDDIHGGQFASMMTKGCETCHTAESWQAVTFSHETTQFPLRGKHAATACSECHKRVETAKTVVRYAGTPTRCSDCHADEHEQQFEVAGQTDCKRCHTETGWHALSFDHDRQSQFVLSGSHARVPCGQCHKKTIVNQRNIVLYKPLGTACVDCHPEK